MPSLFLLFLQMCEEWDIWLSQGFVLAFAEQSDEPGNSLSLSGGLEIVFWEETQKLYPLLAVQ